MTTRRLAGGMLLAALLCFTVPATSQVKVATDPDVKAAIERLRDDAGWWKAREDLCALAADGQRLEALRGMWQAFGSGDDEIHKRAKLTADAINRAYSRKLKKREMEERMDAVRKALARMEGGDDTARGLASLKTAVAALGESLASDAPLGQKPDVFPTGRGPGRPPVSKPTRAPTRSKPTPIGSADDKHTRIVDLPDGRQAVIEVPEGWEDDELEVEFKNGALQVKRVKRAKKDAGKKDGGQKDGKKQDAKGKKGGDDGHRENR